jgi:hypothetical protein
MSTRARVLALLFETDLTRLKTELEGYPDDASVWTVQHGINNSAGTLVLHLTGNLKHFVGASLGKTGYVRDRDAEFADRDLPKQALLQRVDETREVVAKALGRLDDQLLDQPFPGKGPSVLGDAPTSGALLTYMYGHFSYHLGQVNYHRRLLAGS